LWAKRFEIFYEIFSAYFFSPKDYFDQENIVENFLEIFSFWKDCLSRNKIFVAFEKIVNLGLGKSQNFIFKIIELIF